MPSVVKFRELQKLLLKHDPGLSFGKPEGREARGLSTIPMWTDALSRTRSNATAEIRSFARESSPRSSGDFKLPKSLFS